MGLQLNDKKKKLISQDGHILAVGGPGSGKTTIALLKADAIEKSGMLMKNQTILFLSFARATVARVQEQAVALGISVTSKLKINTYHSFFWEILRSHSYLLNGIKTTRILPPPEAAALFAGLNINEKQIEEERLFWEEGIIHFDLFPSLCGQLLSESNSLREIISIAYPYIILDEFQDTNLEEWNNIIELGKDSTLIALADPEQRIYEFRGADPARIGEYITKFKPSMYDFITENHRSNGTDINQFGNDLLTGKHIGKEYTNVKIHLVPSRRGEAMHYFLKAHVLHSIRRLNVAPNKEWSLAVLLPTNRLMLEISDYLNRKQVFGQRILPPISHYVALETAGPSLAAILIANLLDGSEDLLESQLLHDLIDHIKGRNGDRPPSKANLELGNALQKYIETGDLRGTKRNKIKDECEQITLKAKKISREGNPMTDWLKVRELIKASELEVLNRAYLDSTYLRLLRKGSVLQSSLAQLWKNSGTYRGAGMAVRNALLQEHLSTSVRDTSGINVMTLHKSKGKEFDEVIIYEGRYNNRIVRDPRSEKNIKQSRRTLRVAVTRGKSNVKLLTPKDNSCELLY